MVLMQFHKASTGGEGVVFTIVIWLHQIDVLVHSVLVFLFVLYVNILCHVIMSGCSNCFLGITENIHMCGFSLKISFYMSLLDK